MMQQYILISAGGKCRPKVAKKSVKADDFITDIIMIRNDYLEYPLLLDLLYLQFTAHLGAGAASGRLVMRSSFSV